MGFPLQSNVLIDRIRALTRGGNWLDSDFILCNSAFRFNGGSFNGRTTDSDSVNRGSTPRPPAKAKIE